MAELIDISQFKGVKTHADVEDLNDIIAQNMENLKIVDGQLVKTFGAGQPSSIPTFGLSAVNTKFSTTYTVYNVYTFISDKFSSVEYRYILAIIDSNNVLKLFWYDPSLPNVSDHLQIEDNILFFETASDSGFAQSDNVMCIEVKNPSDSAIANTDLFDTINYKTGNKHFVNTNSAKTWGGSFFATATDTGLRSVNFGGKHGTHLFVNTNASNDTTSFTNIALLSLNNKILSMHSYDTGSSGRIQISVGASGVTELNTALYNQFKAYSTFKVVTMVNFNNAIYVYYSALNSGNYYNAIVKYVINSDETITETGIDGHDPDSSEWGDNDYTVATNEAYFYEAGTGDLYLLVPGDQLFKITSSGISDFTTPSNTGGYTWKGVTSITSTHSGQNYEYLVLAESTASNHKFHFKELINNLNWSDGNALANELKMVTKMDFGDDSGTNESIVAYLFKSSGSEHLLKYSQHGSGSALGSPLSWADVNSSVFTTSTVITRIKNAYRHPGGTKYLMVCTDDSGSFGSGMAHGNLYRVATDKTTHTLTDNAADTYKGWNPTCVDDVVTGVASDNQWFEHAKGYIIAYGVEYVTHNSSDASLNNLPRASLIRATDIGWGTGTWGGSGSCDYRWVDIMGKYDFKEISTSNTSSTPTVYHNKDKNPIVATNDTVRFIPGAIGKVSTNEAKGVWVGYINRSLFNSSVTIAPNWYAYSNVLNNPFKLELKNTYKTSSEIRAGDAVKYNCTAIYDGIQETLFDKTKELVITDTGINNSIVELKAEIADITAINKRITGINVYRAIGTSGAYGNFQLIGHMTFIDTNNDLSSVGTAKECSGVFFSNDKIHIKTTDVSTIIGLGYTEFLGNNKYAISSDGGFDGIDSASEGEDTLVPFWINSGTVRPMSASQTYMVVNSNTNILNSTKYIIDNEGIQTAATALPSSPLTSPVDTGFTLNANHDWEKDVQKTFTVTADISNVIKTGDTIRIGSHVSSNIVINSVGTTTFVGTPTATANGIGGNVKIREVVSGEYVVTITRGQSINYADVAYSTNTAVVHTNGSTIRKVPSVNYVQLDCDDNANFGNTYLDSSGNFNGSSWKLKEKSWGSYETKYSGDNGAYGGSSIGFIKFHNYSTDFPSGIAQNALSGSIVMFGEKSFEVEGNSVYQDDIGGVWIKSTEKMSSASNNKDFTGNLLEGFSVATASGSSTPGMGYTKSSNKITITCRDFRLDDLGESPIQTVYSNRVNGQYAKIVKSRLFLGNVNLNPDDKAEERQDYVAYSEINQFDTIPVSNVIAFEDREGGAVTGLASLFNRLVVFKPQAIFILSLSNPTDPTTWQIVESKHNIGNVASRGVVEVHDSVFFVYHDGIYEISANMAASSTATPSVMNKISYDIEDQFNLATTKSQIRGIFDPNRQEIIYRWLESSTERVWAYNYELKTWRKIDMGSFSLTLLNYDENGSPLNYDVATNKIIKFDTNNASITKWKSKKFPLDLHRKRLVRYLTVQYTGNDAMTANVYLDGSGSASFSKTGLSAGTTRFPVKRYANRVELELTSPSSTNDLTIKRLQLEVE